MQGKKIRKFFAKSYFCAVNKIQILNKIVCLLFEPLNNRKLKSIGYKIPPPSKNVFWLSLCLLSSKRINSKLKGMQGRIQGFLGVKTPTFSEYFSIC